MVSIVHSTRDALNFPALRRLSPLRKTLVAVGAYAVWTALTWLLEGRIQTLLRPEAVADRLVYTVLVNVVVGMERLFVRPSEEGSTSGPSV